MSSPRPKTKSLPRIWRYDLSEVEDVYLRNGFTIAHTAYGEAVSVQDLDGLTRAIAKALALYRKKWIGSDIRFVRHQLAMTQSALGELLHCTDQSIARWEKDQVEIPAIQDLALRALVLSKLDGRIDFWALASSPAKEAADRRLTFTLASGQGGWCLK